jgi:hypothetical protein
MDHREAVIRKSIVIFQLGGDHILISHQNQLKVRLRVLQGLDRAPNFTMGGTVRSHGIQGYSQSGTPGSVLVNYEDFLVPIEPTGGAYAMRKLGITAAGTTLGVDRLSLDVGPPLPLALLGCTPFRNCHGSFSLVFQRSEGIPPGIRLLRRALASLFVQILTALWAKPLAAFPTQSERPVGEDHLLPQSLHQVQLRRRRGNQTGFVVFSLPFPFESEEEGEFLLKRYPHVIQTTTTFLSQLTPKGKPHQDVPAGEHLRLTRDG